MRRRTSGMRSLSVVIVGMSVMCVASSVLADDPAVDNSSTTQKLERLKRNAGEKKVVTIYKFRSTVPEVTAQGATDMFTTALIKSGVFVVVERQRLGEGVAIEKELNAQRWNAGGKSPRPLVGAEYIFEGAVTEANANAEKSGVAGTVRGLGVETSNATATIGLDVRVVDADAGVVLGAVNVRKPVKQAGVSATGVGSFLQGLTKKNLHGADVNVARKSKDSVDEALRACIEEAVYELAQRYGQ